MRFPRLRLVRGEEALSGTSAVLETLQARQLRPWPGLGGTNVNTTRIASAFTTAQSASYAWMYGSSPAVRTVVDLIARNVAQLDLRLYEEVSESERVFRPDHNAAISLRYPSDSQTRDQFVRAVVQDFLVFNNAYALKFRERNSQRLVLKPIPAHMVEIMGQELFDPTGYKIHRIDGTELIVDNPADMIHWRGWNPEDPRIGLSPLETLRNVVAEDAALQATNVELAKSGLAGPAWVYRPSEAPEWSNEARQRFEEDLTARLRRASKMPPVMEEGMELRNDGFSPRDAEMLAGRKYAIQQVASVYGVPLGMVGLDDNVDEARSEFYTDVLPPYCEQFTRQLDLSVLVQEYGETEYCFEFNLDEKQMGDERIKTLVSAAGAPVLTRDEARAMLNRPPKEGGDELITPLNVTVGGKPSPQVMPVQDPNKPSQDGDYREDEGPKALPQAKQLEVSTVPRVERDKAAQARYTDQVAGALEKFYANQYRQVKAASKAVDSRDWDRKLGETLHTLVRSIVELEGGIYVPRLGGDDFDMRQVENYLKAMAEGTAEGLNRVTAQDVKDHGVDEAFDRARGERAEVAASAIGTRATVFARQEAARQAPLPETRVKTWVANTDRHSSLNGATVPLASSFGGIEPGSEPNCRCTAVIS